MSTANQFRPDLQGSSPPFSYQFGPFVLDTLQHALLKEGKPVALTPKTYNTLLVLVQNSRRMLSKEELMNALWPDSFVEEANLTQQVSMIRKALGESPSDPKYIATVPSRGYRFMAEVREKPNFQLPVLSAGVSGANAGDATSGDAESGKELWQSVGPLVHLHEKRVRRAAVLLMMIGLVVLAALAGPRLLSRWRSQTAPLAAPRSLAVLPLQNLRQNPDDDFLGFSLADAIITKLDYVSSVTIRPSTAVEKYRDQVIDIQKVGAELNVDTLLTGSFLHDRDKLRITYQLIDVKSDKLLGRGSIDQKYDDLLQVQDNVAERVIHELELKLSPSEAERIKADAAVSPLAYEYYLRGVDLHSQHKFPLAIKMLEKSTEIEPNYALAWAYLGASYNSDAAFEFGGREQYRRAQAAYERALALQPTQLEAHIFLANLFIDTGKVEQAVPLLRDALKTNPNNADVHWELGYAYRFAGMLNESVSECERARQIDPLVKSNGSALNAYLYLGEYDKFLRSLPEANDALVLFYRGFGEYHQRNLDQAAGDFDRAFDLDPDLYTLVGKALSDSIAHRNEDGLERLRFAEKKIAERGVGDPEATYKIAQAYSVLGDKPAALRLLRGSVEGGFFSYPYLAEDPLLDSLRGEPEFGDALNAAQRRYQAFKDKFF
jgi:DNA-binding winged helix-turn-helix (wHTH) protein/TolB-like protein/Tfp pilus assembly protein PilF